MLAWLVTSSGTASACASPNVIASSSGWLRADSATNAPWSSSSRAVAAPMPVDAPMIHTYLPHQSSNLGFIMARLSGWRGVAQVPVGAGRVQSDAEEGPRERRIGHFAEQAAIEIETRAGAGHIHAADMLALFHVGENAAHRLAPGGALRRA